MQSGLIKPIFQSPKSHTTWCEKGWIRKCWEILQDHKIEFNCPSQVCPKLLRIRDASVMEVFVKSNKFKPWQMQILNRCRIYLRVITISDIATACGTKINWIRWRKKDPSPVEHSPYKYPIQPKPDDTQMKVWRSAIRKCIITSRKDKKLRIPLGDWTRQPRQRFEWYARPNKFSLIHIPAKGEPRHTYTKKHHNSKGGLREYHSQSRNNSDNLTTKEMTNLLHAYIKRTKSGTIRLEHSTHQYIELEPPPKTKATTVQEYIKQMQPFFATLFPPLEQFGTQFTTDFKNATSEGTIKARAEGNSNMKTRELQVKWDLFHQLEGTHTKIAGNEWIYPSHAAEARTQRGAQLGILALLVMEEATRAIGASIDEIIINASTYDTIQWTKYKAPRQVFNCLSKPNSDVGKELQKRLKTTKCRLTREKKDGGEQSESEEDTPTPTPITTTTQQITPMPTEFPPKGQYTLTIDGTKYNYLPEKLLHERETLPSFKRFLAKHCDIQEKKFNNIAWDLTARAIDTFNISKMIPIVKYTSNEWATGDKMHLYFKEEEACPFCGQKENMKHVLSCNNEKALKHRDEALTNLETRLNKINKTKGKEWHILASHSIKELRGDTRLETPETDTIHHHHHHHQTEIGWLNFLQGLVAK
jgi:hypothetical protein